MSEGLLECKCVEMYLHGSNADFSRLHTIAVVLRLSVVDLSM